MSTKERRLDHVTPGKPPSGPGPQLGYEKQVLVAKPLGKGGKKFRVFLLPATILTPSLPHKQMGTHKFYLLNAHKNIHTIFRIAPFDISGIRIQSEFNPSSNIFKLLLKSNMRNSLLRFGWQHLYSCSIIIFYELLMM